MTNFSLSESSPRGDASPSARKKLRPAKKPHDHSVQFYDQDSFLADSIATYFIAGWKAGEAVVFIATQEHREAVEKRLERAGLDLAEESGAGRYFALDAAETLSHLMKGDAPSAELFATTLGPVLTQAEEGGRKVRAFGEMVALLWKEERRAAAIELEELWNEMADAYCFQLLCAYPMKDFEGGCFSEGFAHICTAHSHVLPTENFDARDNLEPARLRQIALLQQKALSLESELAKRKAAEEELCDFLENATEPIHKVSEDGAILWANRAEMDFLGYAPEEYIGQPVANFHADADVIADIFARLKRGEKLENYEARLKHKDGSIRVVAINSSVYWNGERFRYTRCFSRDITEQRRAKEVLEQLVKERTAELTEKIGELEAFSYSVSHDMRSPLRAMQGYAKSLIEDYGSTLDTSACDRLRRMQRAAERLDALVRDVLCYSRVAQGNFDLKPISLKSLWSDLRISHPEFANSADRIVVEELHEVIGNEAYLAQCVTNLIENGLKFAAPGKISRVRLSSEILGDKVRVVVSDNGIGISPEHRDRIFQIFGRVYSSKIYEGTGIGLAIVKKAVTRMRGECGFESEYGVGSKFWFTLPRADKDE